MTAARNLTPSDEAHWTGIERVWASVEQWPPRKREHSSWWLVLMALALVGIAFGVLK